MAIMNKNMLIKLKMLNIFNNISIRRNYYCEAFYKKQKQKQEQEQEQEKQKILLKLNLFNNNEIIIIEQIKNISLQNDLILKNIQQQNKKIDELFLIINLKNDKFKF